MTPHMSASGAGTPRVLVVLPGPPDSDTGGGAVLRELLSFLTERAVVAALVPIAAGGDEVLDRVRADPLLAGKPGAIEWHALRQSRVPGVCGYAMRAIGRLPSDAAKIATEPNRAFLEQLRREFRPTVELAVSSWTLPVYRGLSFAANTRLFMVNVDHTIVRQSIPAVLTARSIRKALVRQVACAIDRPKVLAMSRRALSTASRVGAISQTDVAMLEGLRGRSDVEYLPPLMRPRPLDRSNAIPGSVLITTNFTYAPNVGSLAWFLRDVWPRVSPQATLTVAGIDDEGQLAALCRRHPRVSFAGFLVPARLDETFARTAVAVNPTRWGSGFQVKLLDAIARGVPIVSTAWSNKLGPAIPSSDDPAQLAALITARLALTPTAPPGSTPPFDYASFYREAIAAWEAFLFA